MTPATPISAYKIIPDASFSAITGKHYLNIAGTSRVPTSHLHVKAGHRENGQWRCRHYVNSWYSCRTLFLAAKVILVLNALIYSLIGVGVIIDPSLMEDMGISVVTATGTTTTRTWGAIFAGVGVTGLFAAAQRDWVTAGLFLFVMIGAFIVSARVCGIWLDGPEPRQWVELRREGIGFMAGLTGLASAWAARHGRMPDN